MADDDFRSYRRDTNARDKIGSTGREGASDPLAELARLIGQGDPYAERGHDAYDPRRADDPAGAPGLDWAADESYADPRYDRPEDRYVAPPPPPPAASYAPQDRGYEDEPPASDRYFSGPAAKFNGFREDADADYGDEQPPVVPTRQLPGLMSAAAAAPTDRYEAEEARYDGGDAYAAGDYQDDGPGPRRRSGLIVVMAVFGLAVIGTASAFGYRYMFGGSVLPTLPPIIKASNGPNKIVPGGSEAQLKNSSQTNVASAGSSENLVSREEQPVNIEQPPAAPRVVSTIPITSAPSPVQSGSPSSSPWPTAPAPIPGYSAGPSPSVAAAAPTQPTGQLPAPASSEPRKIHTVTIHADQSGGSDAVPAPAPTSDCAGASPGSAEFAHGGGQTEHPDQHGAAGRGERAAIDRSRCRGRCGGTGTLASTRRCGPGSSRQRRTGCGGRGQPAVWRRLCRASHLSAQRGRSPSFVPSAAGQIPHSAERPPANHPPRRSRRQGHLLPRPGRPLCLGRRGRRPLQRAQGRWRQLHCPEELTARA